MGQNCIGSMNVTQLPLKRSVSHSFWTSFWQPVRIHICLTKFIGIYIVGNTMWYDTLPNYINVDALKAAGVLHVQQGDLGWDTPVYIFPSVNSFNVPEEMIGKQTQSTKAGGVVDTVRNWFGGRSRDTSPQLLPPPQPAPAYQQPMQQHPQGNAPASFYSEPVTYISYPAATQQPAFTYPQEPQTQRGAYAFENSANIYTGYPGHPGPYI